jgi:hypothetical protein
MFGDIRQRDMYTAEIDRETDDCLYRKTFPIIYSSELSSCIDL